MDEDLEKDIEEIEANLMTEEEEDELIEASVELCVCGIPSLDEIVQCTNTDCEVLWFHKECVGLTLSTSADSENAGDITKDWLCADCNKKQDKQYEEASTEGSTTTTTSKVGKSQQKAKMVYPVVRLLKDDVLQQSLQKLKDGISSIFTDELFSINTPLARSLKTFSQRLIQNDENLKEFAMYATEQLWDILGILQGKTWTEERKVKMWTAFHTLCCSSEIKHKWAATLETLDLQRDDDVDVFVLQHVLEYMHDKMLTDMMKIDCPLTPSTSKAQTMDKHEEQALRYAVGYIPFKLMKKLKKNGEK